MVLFPMILSDRWPRFQAHYDLLNGAIVDDLERPQTQISRSHRYLPLNISETVRDRDIVTMK